MNKLIKLFNLGSDLEFCLGSVLYRISYDWVMFAERLYGHIHATLNCGQRAPQIFALHVKVSVYNISEVFDAQSNPYSGIMI